MTLAAILGAITGTSSHPLGPADKTGGREGDLDHTSHLFEGEIGVLASVQSNGARLRKFAVRYGGCLSSKKVGAVLTRSTNVIGPREGRDQINTRPQLFEGPGGNGHGGG